MAAFSKRIGLAKFPTPDPVISIGLGSSSLGGAQQWTPKEASAAGSVPDAHDPSKRHAPMMTTADLALRMDPVYAKIAKRFLENPQELADAFAKAWYKLTHRDMGPLSRYLGPLVPAEPAPSPQWITN